MVCKTFNFPSDKTTLLHSAQNLWFNAANTRTEFCESEAISYSVATKFATAPPRIKKKDKQIFHQTSDY